MEELLHSEYVIHFSHGDRGRATTSSREQLLERVKKFYEDHQDPVLISEPAPTLPVDMAIRVSDAELVGILQAQETLNISGH
ncbi:hypothetical protein QFZ94_008935 [Paraburkholderia sp. JPY465]|uniref:hypothetical protein n=1 Tax=Paraburkholderia sp. JPY465 TaxID=3042285 RepID=UPI003D1E27C5